MIKIILFNIIITVLHLASVESTDKMLGVNINAAGICMNTSGIYLNHVFDITKGVTYDSSNNNSHSSGITVKLINTRFPELNIEKFKVVEINYRNKFEFFESGVSPPVTTMV